MRIDLSFSTENGPVELVRNKNVPIGKKVAIIYDPRAPHYHALEEVHVSYAAMIAAVLFVVGLLYLIVGRAQIPSNL